MSAITTVLAEDEIATMMQAVPNNSPRDDSPLRSITDNGENDNDPYNLAHQLIALISDIPAPSPNDSVPSKDRKFECDQSGKPLMPPDAPAHVKSQTLIKKLMDRDIMNIAKDNNLKDVFSVIDHEKQETPTIMLYSPLIPEEDSTVDIGQKVTVKKKKTLQVHEALCTEVKSDSTTIHMPLEKVWHWIWPKHGNKHSEKSKKDSVWLPSTTKLSCQVMWWGFRLYLPPHIMSVLNDDSIEAAKRATMITTALTWFLSHIPVALLPPPVAPVVLLLQMLAPFVGYLGTFISWSWDTIKEYDVGYGIHLSATWLLPLALIPGTWQSYDFPSATPTPSMSTTEAMSIPIASQETQEKQEKNNIQAYPNVAID